MNTLFASQIFLIFLGGLIGAFLIFLIGVYCYGKWDLCGIFCISPENTAETSRLVFRENFEPEIGPILRVKTNDETSEDLFDSYSTSSNDELVDLIHSSAVV